MSGISAKRIEWIDTAKGIGLLLVIFGHLHVPYVTTWIYSFHMPLFFFLSGVVYSGYKYNFKEYLIKRIKSLVIPYFTLGFIIWIFYAAANLTKTDIAGMYGTNTEMLKGLLIQEHFWTVWFLACLFLTEIIYYAIERVLKGKTIIISILSTIICILGLLRYRFGYGSLPWNLDVALVAQFFFNGGYMFKQCTKLQSVVFNQKNFVYIIQTGLFLFINAICAFLCIKVANEALDMSVGLYGNEILTIISAFSGILFIAAISFKLHSKALLYLGKNTMLIFALHSRIMIVLCNYIYSELNIFQGTGIIEKCIYAIVTFLIIMIVLIPLNESLKKFKYCWIFGV